MRRVGSTARLASLAFGLVLLAAPAGAVDVRFTAAGLPGCINVSAGLASCDSRLLDAGDFVTITWSLDSVQSLSGYDLDISWDPEELTLFSCENLYPDTDPGSVQFLVSPCDGNDPAGSRVLAIAPPPARATTALFSLTFQVSEFVSCDTDGLVDFSWTPNPLPLVPDTVVLTNPAGASGDMTVPLRECNDGLDNDNDGKIDYDGGLCAGLPPAQQTEFPDPECLQPLMTKEAKVGRCGLGFELGLLLPFLAWRHARRRREG